MVNIEARVILVDDPGGSVTAVSSDALLGLVVDLDDWGSVSVVTLKGTDGWTVPADITSVIAA